VVPFPPAYTAGEILVSIDVAELIKCLSETITKQLENLPSKDLRRKLAQEIALEIITEKIRKSRNPYELLHELETDLWLRYDILLSSSDRERIYRTLNGLR